MVKKENIIETCIKLSHWLWFGLILSLIPVIYSVWKLSGVNESGIFDSFTKAISHGELMLICMSTLAASIGEIAFKETNWKFMKVWLTGATTVLAILTVLTYADVAVINYSKPSENGVSLQHALNTSISLFWATVALAVACLVLPEKGKEYVTRC